MILETQARIQRYLADHRHFQESILENVAWLSFGLVIEVTLRVVLDEQSRPLPDLESREPVTLRFHGVHELYLKNALNSTQVLQPRLVNWGFSEIAELRLLAPIDESDSLPGVPLPVHRVRFAWENQRRIDVSFATLEVLDQEPDGPTTRR